MNGFEKIIENRILQAQKNGIFDNLSGEGKPFEFKDDSYVPEDLKMAYKILKNADCLPPELEIKKEIRKTEDLLATMPDTEEKYRILKKLNLLIMKFNILSSSSFDRDMPQYYHEKLVDQFGK
ncbi:DUF1992 domain-containing protein [Candidatus Magnetomoraceae bacterium gMMP-1]